MKTSSKPTVREEPRISINKLGEYMTGSPHNRKTILTDQKRPKGFKRNYYQAAELAIINYLSSSTKRESVLTEVVYAIEAERPGDDYNKIRNRSNIEAIQSFKRSFANDLNLEGFSVKPGGQKLAKLKVGGVKISVRPELILTSKNEENNQIGVVKLYFSKSNPLDNTTGDYISTTTHQWVERELVANDLEAPHHLTLVLDVMNGKVFTPPKAYIQRMKDIKAACEEINARWPHL